MRAFIMITVAAASLACVTVPQRRLVDVCAGSLTCDVIAERVLVGEACTASVIDIIDGPDDGHGPATSSLNVVAGENCSCASATLISWQPETWRIERDVRVTLNAWEVERIQSDLVEVKRADAVTADGARRITFGALLSRARGGLSDELVCSIAALRMPARAFSGHWPVHGAGS